MKMQDRDYTQLPTGLPVPRDDGGAAHLQGMRLDGIVLPSPSGRSVDLGAEPGLVVVYCYPMTGRPGTPLPDGWDEIPGARGCTPQACAFRDHAAELAALNARVYGVSTQSPAAQREAAVRLDLPFELLSDAELALATALRLPTFTVDGTVMLRRLTLIMRAGRIEHVMYPVFPPDRNAPEVVQWLSEAEGATP
jgi:peroxiredoxin